MAGIRRRRPRFRRTTPGSAYNCHYSDLWYRTGQSGTWLDPGSDALLAVGPGDRALVRTTSTIRVITGGVAKDVTGLPPWHPIDANAARWEGGSFLVSIVMANYTDISLYRVDASAAATLVGAYKMGGTPSSSSYSECVLESGGAMWCFTSQFGSSDTVHRFTLTADPTLEYDEAAHAVKIHASYLATGH